MGSYEVRGVKPLQFLRGPVFMLLICSAFTEVSADSTDLFHYNQNQGLPRHDDQLIVSITSEECAQKCLEGTAIIPEGECLSFDYVKSISRCQLSRDNNNTAGQPLVSHDDYDHYEMKDILRFFTAYPDQALPRHDDVIVRPATVSPRTCTLRCLMGEGRLSVGSCLSFDLDSNPEKCLLSRDNQDTAGETLGFNARFDHYQRNEFCVPNPCIHGNCTSEANGYTCTCDVGWEGDACDTFTACSPGEFGPGCNGTCHCLTGDSACNIQTGACTGGCAAGWKGNDCQTVCSPGDFGPGCTGTCNCLNGDSACNIQTGACIGGCAAGWKGNDCQTACTPGEFGPGCNGTCNCLTGDSACNIQTGACTGGCAAGWKGNDCQTVCSPGEFGSNCVSTCHCADGDSVCLADTGNCSRGGCADGWEGDSCQIDVDECDTDVDNCHIYATCLNSAGSFNCSCNLGYQGNGTSCTEQKAVGLPLVGIIVGVVAGVIVIGAVVAVVFYRRRKNKDAPKQRNVPLKNIGNQPKQGGARNDAFDSENGRDTSTSERLSDLTTVADVQRFLIANGLQECARAFRENDVDGTALRHLDDAMMKDLVPMVGPRARLKAVLQGLSGSGTLVSSPTSALNFWEIPRSSLKLGRRLGRGQFGEVRLGEVRNNGVATTVAVKTLRDSASDSDKKDLLGELEILVTVGRHDNIVSLVGACTKDDPLTIVVEYAPNGCLKDWLKNNSVEAMSGHSEYQNRPVHVSELPMEQLIQFGIDVAAGMSHLAAMQCVHRDLAARNILLGELLVAKLSDFGLSRDVFESEEYVKSTMSKLPLRWMAYESLFYSVYTTQSDVWSFGVLLWEIMTMGHLPYEGMRGKQMMDMIKNGGRLEQPLHCPDELFAVMQDCWKTLPEDRPTFPQLKTNLDRIIQAHKPYASLLHG